MFQRIIGIFAALLSLTVLGCTLPDTEKSWSVVSWNVQNIFDGEDDGTEYDEFDPGRGTWNDRLYRRRLDRCGEVLNACSLPDLVILQELEKPGILDDLADGPLRNGRYQWRLAVPGFGIIRCGILSRHPLREISVIDCGQYGERDLRPALSFTVDTPGGPVKVIAVHWKSPRDGRAATEEIRRREALEVRKLAEASLAIDSDLQLLIIGDLNTPGDGYVQPAALAPWSPDRDGNLPDAVLYRSEYAEGAGIRDGVLVFFDPEPEGSAGGTYWYQDAWDRPDRGLLSRGLTDPPGLQFQSCRTGANEIMGGADGRPTAWRTDLEEGYSDHLPLIIEFRTTTDQKLERNESMSSRGSISLLSIRYTR